jgi:uncharacterized damage-inducible protein DinB
MQPDQASTILGFLMGSVQREHGVTKRVIQTIPADRSDYTPDPKSKSALELAWHIAASEQGFMNLVVTGGMGGGPRPESIQTPADIATWYEEQWTANIARLKELTGEQLARIVDFHGMFQIPAVGFVQLMINHSVHHRGQLSTYLRPMGAKVPSIYGPSGDEGIPGA